MPLFLGLCLCHWNRDSESWLWMELCILHLLMAYSWYCELVSDLGDDSIVDSEGSKEPLLFAGHCRGLWSAKGLGIVYCSLGVLGILYIWCQKNKGKHVIHALIEVSVFLLSSGATQIIFMRYLSSNRRRKTWKCMFLSPERLWSHVCLSIIRLSNVRIYASEENFLLPLLLNSLHLFCHVLKLEVSP